MGVETTMTSHSAHSLGIRDLEQKNVYNRHLPLSHNVTGSQFNMAETQKLGFEPLDEPKLFHESQEIPSKIHASNSHLLGYGKKDQGPLD